MFKDSDVTKLFSTIAEKKPEMPDVRPKFTALPPLGTIANMQQTDSESHRKYDRPSHPKNRTMVKGDRTSP
ncbi:hypothetical protein QUA30_22320 [Microcoleus sp. Pol14C2]|uniref:hypothetical protein n=1 Tax=unclassified Microcoleus TaxID=2642155 RepID=UPI002FD5ABBB